MSQKFSQLVNFLLVLTVTFALVTPVQAASSAKPQSGEGFYSYSECYNGVLYTGEGHWTWKAIPNKVALYQWSNDGKYAAYNNCGGGTLIYSGWYTDYNLSRFRNGQWSYNGHSRGNNGYNSYRYTVVTVNGEPKVYHFWLNGQKVY